MKTALLTFALLAAATPVPKPGAAPKKRGFPALRAQYVDTFWKRFPVTATYFGAEGLDPANARLDGKLRDDSPAALAAERRLWEALRDELKRVDRTSLSEADRIDAEVMAAQIAFLLRNLDRELHEKSIDVYLEEPLRGSEWLLQGMTPREGGLGTASEWKALAARVGSVPAYLKTALANLRRGATSGSFPDRRMIRHGVEGAATTAEYFEKTLPERLRKEPLIDGETRRAALAASAAAGTAFRDFGQGLRALYFDQAGNALKKEFDRDRFALGEEGYAWALRNNLRVAKTPRELFAYGRAKVNDTLAQMSALAKEIAAAHAWPETSLPAVMTRLSDDTPKTDAEMLSWYRDACRRLVEYGRTTGMFVPPDDYRLEVVFTPPPLRAALDAAYYPAPIFKKTGVGQFYVTPTGDDPAALRAHARAAVASLAAHEGFPGHDWYYKVLAARADRISPVRFLTPGGVEDSASMWEDSMSSEGWALYCERLVGEPRPGFPEGFYTKEERLFQLQNQLLRDARIVADVGIHCGVIGFDDAVSFFARNVYQVQGAVSTDPAANGSAAERASVEQARRDIFRYSKWPTQAITYHLGKAAILELREKARSLEGERFDERRFHEELLSYGSIPAAYFEASLLSAIRSRVPPTPQP